MRVGLVPEIRRVRFHFCFFLIAISVPAKAYDDFSFSRDVLPILSDNCFACHGPDVADRKSDLRLDSREQLLKSVSLDRPAESELLARIRSTDPGALMPPPLSHKKPLSSKQIEVLEKWIEAGAPWGKHWAFEFPAKVPLEMDVENHPIDALVAKRLAKEGLRRSPSAPPYTLQRRLSLDLLGLPPSPNATVFNGSESSIEDYVDELLASPHFGERMAMWWLDVARYSDTDGFQADATRTNWPWRDWVVNAFNQNMPLDQFTIEQFAGDLLPNASDEQKLATCFHRNHMTNGEGGRDPEESRVDYVIDRVNTFGTVWLGLTVGCCQCHSHKFDPISHKDYYSLSAFFNSIDEDGKAGDNAKPYLSYKSDKTAHAIEEASRLVEERKPAEELARKLAEIPFEGWLETQIAVVRDGFEAWKPLLALVLESSEGTTLTQLSDATVLATGRHPNQDEYRFTASPNPSRVTGLRLEILPYHLHTGGGLSRGASGEFILTDIKLQVRRRGSSQVRDIRIESAIADFSADKKKNDNYGDVKDTLDDDPRNGWTTKGEPNTQPHLAVFALEETLTLDEEEELVIELRQRSTLGDANIGRFRISTSEQLGEAVRSVKPSPLEDLGEARVKEAASLDKALRGRLFDQFLQDYLPYQEPKGRLVRAQKQLAEVKKAGEKLKVMVLEERKEQRETHVLLRGVWDKHGERVEPGVPNSIAPWPEGQEKTRLGLAKWIVNERNPLTARVLVNHIWQLFFGQGLVRTQEDFGLQGEAPTHSELLDWLAVELMESRWNLKQLVRLIVTSKTYQQSSLVSTELLVRDPYNKMLARGARFRMPSWILRDAALHASGLLNPALGGPPVRPYQPDGVWEELFMGRFKYEPSEGNAQYRRSIYAFWRRSIAPTFLFDSAQRRTCEVRTGRTNTPLHALTLLNDTTYLEASRALAIMACNELKDGRKQLTRIFQCVLGREPNSQELRVLEGKAAAALNYYQEHQEDATKLLRVGQAIGTHDRETTARIATAMIAASIILNLDEAISHE
ncbi:MAG TPA: PSD1 and planctomycete cytochrome C domain-containing protein [Pirellula sp.]|nr:PSD1 and planctomycete cytochrome C domain-containing protein [Pirellula sp.]